MLELAIDNDVIIKLAEYGLLGELGHFGCPTGCPHESGALGSAKFVGRDRLTRRIERGDVEPSVVDTFLRYLDSVRALEPTEAELALSAQLEEWALLNSEPLDQGESQLLAIAASQGSYVLTGDKRAIASAERALGTFDWLESLAHQLACLEQALLSLNTRIGAGAVQVRVCASPTTDRAISICYSCGDKKPGDFDPAGLLSYINSVRGSAPTLLAEPDPPQLTKA